MIKSIKYKLSFFLLSTSLIIPSYAAEIIEGKHYSKIDTEITDAPKVIEFFSFYCPPCAAFSVHLGINDVLEKKLPKNTRLIKYHVSTMGEFGRELTEAWSIAKVLGVQSKMEKIIFNAVQEKNSIKSKDDIKQLFIDIGVPADKYDSVKDSLSVRSLTLEQINAANDFKVTGTPSYYVAGKYLLHNGGIDGSDVNSYSVNFSNVVNKLLEK